MISKKLICWSLVAFVAVIGYHELTLVGHDSRGVPNGPTWQGSNTINFTPGPTMARYERENDQDAKGPKVCAGYRDRGYITNLYRYTEWWCEEYLDRKETNERAEALFVEQQARRAGQK